MDKDGIVVRINGVMPANNQRVGDSGANTSCSIFSIHQNQAFHMLVDIGEGVLASVRRGVSELGLENTLSIPDAVLITHAHEDHIKELPTLLLSEPNSNIPESDAKGSKEGIDNNSSFHHQDSKPRDLKIFCTKECIDMIIKKYPSVSAQEAMSHFVVIQPGMSFEAGPFSVVPVPASHHPSIGDGEISSSADDGSSGSVIYVIRADGTKIITGWDFLSIPEANQDLLWSPDLLILGTETYNDHPSTGMISVLEAYNLIRMWNAKNCYIVHYSGEKDIEDAVNQWYRGPRGPMKPEELQKVIDNHLQVIGGDGKFSVKVASQGMVWRAPKREEFENKEDMIGGKIEIESPDRYTIEIEKADNNRLGLVIEDRVNRLSLRFANPTGNGETLQADPVKEFMSKGPGLVMHLAPGVAQDSDTSLVRINITKGKKQIFANDVRITNRDAQRLSRYIKENFTSQQKFATAA